MQPKTNSALRWSYGLFFFVIVAFLIAFALADSLLNSFPTWVQRGVLIGLVVLPSAVGTLTGILSVFRPPRKPVLSILAVILNGLTFLYFAFLASFAG